MTRIGKLQSMDTTSMQGRRVGDHKDFPLERPGDYSVSFHKTSVCMTLPNGVFVRVACSLDGQVDAKTWGLVEHEDGTITLTPSINLHPGEGDTGWHGFLERGYFRSC